MPPNPPPNKRVASPRVAWRFAQCRYPNYFSKKNDPPPPKWNLDTPLVEPVSLARGTRDSWHGWRSLFPLPANPPRIHSRLYHHPGLRTDGRRRIGWLETRTLECAPFWMPFEARGVLYAWGHVQPANVPPHTNYLRLGWWSTDRPLPMNDVRGRWVFDGGRT